MLNITLDNWRNYSDNLGFNTVPELAKALGVPIRTLNSWLYKQRKPAEYTSEILKEKLNSIVRDRYIELAKVAAKKIIKAGKETEIRKLKTDLVRAIQYKDWPRIFTSVLQMSCITDVYTEFLDILILDWKENDKDYYKTGYFYSVIQTFIIALI